MKPDRPLIDWIAGESRELPLEALVPQLVARLEAMGCGPILRLNIGGTTMHPEVFAVGVRWTPERGVEVERFPHRILEDPTFPTSPIGLLIERETEVLRLPLDSPDADRFELTRAIRDAGGTEYLLFSLLRHLQAGWIASFATTRPGGFSDEQFAILEGILPVLRMRVEIDYNRTATAELLRTYLGGNASQRVLEGAFRRGTGQRLRAVVWMSDLRDFTGRTDRETPEHLLAALDAYFTAVAEPIAAHGGEVLKLIGDAVLGVFLLDDDPAGTCGRALSAALDAFDRMARTNREREDAGLDPLAFGLALHVGEVMYGNIGTTQRLDFTVIGRPVNEVSRVESLCKELGVPLLLTDAFVTAAGHPDVRALGRHRLRGVREPVEIFTHRRFEP
ncbi:MAG: adenylate/guanylate cyclase domain-containing protein [Myxococcota bacterium]